MATEAERKILSHLLGVTYANARAEARNDFSKINLPAED